MNEQKKKHIFKIVICLIIVVTLSGVSMVTGLFEGLADLETIFHFDLKAVVKVVIMAAFVLAIGSLVQVIVTNIKTQSKRVNTLLTIVSSLMKYMVAIVVICWGLTILGVDVSTIFASIGLLALIVGFGAESLIEDVITGLFMIFENQYNVGDIIEVDGFRGRVQSIGIRATSIVDTGENVKIINNSAMKNILNRSTDVSKAVCDVAIPYEVDLVKLEEKIPKILENIQKQNPQVIAETPVYVGVQELADSAVVLRIVASVNEREIYNATRILNRQMYLALKEMKVEMPYKQIDIHMK